MRALKIAISVLVILFALILANSFAINKITSGLAERVERIEYESYDKIISEYEKISEDFKRAERLISLTVSHEDLTNIEESLAEIIGAAMAEDMSSIITIKSRLRDSLFHLGRLSSVNLDSIL